MSPQCWKVILVVGSGSHLTKDNIPAALWSRDGYSRMAVPGARLNWYSYGLYMSPWLPAASDGETRGGGPPFRYACDAAAMALDCDVWMPRGSPRGARIRGAPAGVGDRSCCRPCMACMPAIPPSGDVMNRAASVTQHPHVRIADTDSSSN